MTKLSDKIIKEYKQGQFANVVDFSQFKNVKKQLNQIDTTLTDKFQTFNYDPSHKIYSILQNLLSYFVEEITVFDEFTELYNELVEMEEIYMPSYPPNSPLTGSYYTYSCFFDLRFGKARETAGSIFFDLGQVHNFDDTFMKALSNVNKSYMSFYKHLGMDNDMVILKDIVTDKKYSCIIPSGYRGEKGEIWFARILPNLDEIYNYEIVITTPYVIEKYKETDWLAFFKRKGVDKETLGYEKKYLTFMKNNQDTRYWHNYILDGYVNYQSNCIFLTGIPDIVGSKPHEL